MSESKLMRAQNGFKCSTCYYFQKAPTGNEVVTEVPYCENRGRQIGWNPLLFMCGDYAAKDEPLTMQTSLDWRWNKGEAQ